MARVQLSGIITDINGSVNGWTFQNSLQGKTVRVRPNQTQIGTYKRQLVKQQNIFIQKVWSGLTGSEKADWNTFAGSTAFTDIYGNVKSVSGYQYFYSCYYNSTYLGGISNRLAPIGGSFPVAIPTFTVILNPTTLVLHFSSSFSHPDTRLIVFCSLPTNNIQPHNRRVFKFTMQNNAGYSPDAIITSDWETMSGLNYAATYTSGRFYINVYAFFMMSINGLITPAHFASGSNS